MYLCEIHLPVDITPSSLLSFIYNLIGGHLFGTKFIPIKVGIVRLCVPDVHAKRVTLLHNLDDMTHHTHPMKTGLSIEKHRIAIHHMTMNDVAILQFNG